MNQTLRYLFLICLLNTSFTTGQAQTSETKLFTVNGHFSGQHTDSVLVMYTNGSGRYIKKYVPVKNQLFRITDTLLTPISITIRSAKYKQNPNTESELTFYAEEGDNHLELAEGMYSKAKLPDNPTQRDLQYLKGQIKQSSIYLDSTISAKQTSMQMQGSTMDSAVQMELKYEIDSLEVIKSKRIADATKKFIRSHPKSYVSLQWFYSIIDFTEPGELLPLLFGLAHSLQQTLPGKDLLQFLTAIEESREGNPLPKIDMVDLKGNLFNTQSLLKDGPILFDFWASWCIPCIQDLPQVKRMAALYASRGLTVIFVSIDGKDEMAWKKAIEKYDLEAYRHFLVQGNSIDAITKNLAVQGIPDKILVDKQGKIVYRKVGSGTELLWSTLKQIISED
jgi:thiol-disulfide isomerase/thioredoxin